MDLVHIITDISSQIPNVLMPNAQELAIFPMTKGNTAIFSTFILY